MGPANGLPSKTVARPFRDHNPTQPFKVCRARHPLSTCPGPMRPYRGSVDLFACLPCLVMVRGYSCVLFLCGGSLWCAELSCRCLFVCGRVETRGVGRNCLNLVSPTRGRGSDCPALGLCVSSNNGGRNCSSCLVIILGDGSPLPMELPCSCCSACACVGMQGRGRNPATEAYLHLVDLLRGKVWSRAGPQGTMVAVKNIDRGIPGRCLG